MEFWKEHYSWMTPEQWLCFEMLCDLFYGAHHVSGKVKPCGDSGIEINTRAVNTFASFDFNNLTRAVVMAHDRAIRFGIDPSGPGMLRLSLHYRGNRDGLMHVRHPTLESHIQSIRGK